MQKKSMDELLGRFREIAFKEDFDMIIAIGRGGIIPAAVINQRLNLPLKIIDVSFRDENNKPKEKAPVVIRQDDISSAGKIILIVDDVSKSGRTFNSVKSLLSGAALLKTFVVNGKADYSLYDEDCFKFPWRLD